jgi:hypothetical protein
MNLLSGTATKTFNLLSIGQRGVGKTVFLAGSYAELHPDYQTDHPQKLWFDCQDRQAQENIESILNYIARTGQYPPPTMKITDFDFSLKCHSFWGVQTLCHFRWWDIPGEICNVRNSDFRAIVSTSHSCCVFIDAYALVHKSTYRQAFKDIVQQVMAIATLVSLNRLEYAFGLILTKYDLLESGPFSRSRLEESLRPLTTHLDTMKASYQAFYSNIPIVHTNDTSTLKATGAAAPLLWLVWELGKAHNTDLMSNPLKLVNRLLPGRFQPRQKPTNGLTQSLQKPTSRAFEAKKIPGLLELRWRLLPTPYKYILILVLVFAGLVGIISSPLVNYKWDNQPSPAQQSGTR